MEPFVIDISICLTTDDRFSAFHLSDAVDLPLLDRLPNFSPRPVMTNSGWLCNSLLCLLRMKSQKAPRDARSTTATGTTIAGMMVPRFEDDF